MELRLFTIGDSTDRNVNSGTPHQLYQALLKQHPNIACVDVSLNKFQKVLNLAHSFHPKLQTWQEKSRKNQFVYNEMSKNAFRGTKKLSNPDYFLQFQTLFSMPDSNIPFGIYTDYTSALAEKEFPDWLPFPNKKQMSKWLIAEQENYHRAAHIFTFTERVRQSVIKDFWVDPDKVYTVGAGCKFKIHSDSQRKERPVRNFLFIGKEPYRKGLDLLLIAFKFLQKKYPDISLTVVGTKINRKYRNLHNFPKINNHDYLHQIIKKSDVFVMPSRGEPFGYVYLEAMAHGIPCIGANVGGVSEVINDKTTGFLIEKENIQELIYKMEKLIIDPDLSHQMGINGQLRLKHKYRWSDTATAMLTQISHT